MRCHYCLEIRGGLQGLQLVVDKTFEDHQAPQALTVVEQGKALLDGQVLEDIAKRAREGKSGAAP